MHKLLLELPDRIETPRLTLRPYRSGDGPWYCTMSLRNQEHLRRYEAGNPAMSIKNEVDAEIVMREYAMAWLARQYFFLGAFIKELQVFTAQVYIGAVNWDLPEFVVGYFADQAHEGLGYVTEAVKGALSFIFKNLQAGRVRLECDDTNLRSVHVAERCGFKLEGNFRQDKKHLDGTISGTLLYGLLRSEYEAGLARLAS